MKNRANDSSCQGSIMILILLYFCIAKFGDIVDFVSRHLHINSTWAIWAIILLPIPCILSLFMVVRIGMAFNKLIMEFVEGRKRCPHGIRKINEQQCAQCSSEKAFSKKQFADESAERELRKRLLAESKALRSEEIARLSKAWLAQSDYYFSMSPTEFEDAVARLFMELGYEVKQTPYSNDGGKDAILWKDNKKYVVECKRYNREALTGRRDLQILIAAMHDEGADGAFFVSTGRFARTAVEYAMENKITIYDGDHLSILVNDAFGNKLTIPEAKVMCQVCGEIVTFDIFSGNTIQKNCMNLHDVTCNIDLADLKVATTIETPFCPNCKVPMRMVRERKGNSWRCSVYRCNYSIRLNYLTSSATKVNEQIDPDKATAQEAKPEEEINCVTLAKSRRWNIWAPIFEGYDSPNMSLAVPCGTTTPNREEYLRLLYT